MGGERLRRAPLGSITSCRSGIRPGLFAGIRAREARPSSGPCAAFGRCGPLIGPRSTFTLSFALNSAGSTRDPYFMPP